MQRRRDSGILLPVSALPSHFGIGDFGPAAYRFVDWLKAAGQQYWQVLPLTIPDSVGSPYASPSSVAGNWLLIDPQDLAKRDWLTKKNIPHRWRHDRVRYSETSRQKRKLLHQAWAIFQEKSSKEDWRSWQRFVHQNQFWLARFSLYQAIKDGQAGQPWWRWPKALQRYDWAVERITTRIAQRRAFHCWLQWLFWQQWASLKSYANKQGVKIIGDLPFYVPLDSVEVWARPELFELDRHGHPTMVAGVPPDGLADQGQRWGNPVYRWAEHRQTKFRWWLDRFRLAQRQYDLIRLDHFRGLVATWHIPARNQKPGHGRWVASPGRELLTTVRRRFPKMQLIAEDLGKVTPEVSALRQKFSIPAVRVLQYAWSGLPHNMHHPAYIDTNTIYYLSTHDTNTTAGWWQTESQPHERENIHRFAGHAKDIVTLLLGVLNRSQARIVIIPIQDVLRLGPDARFNHPGTKRRNWAWRLSWDALQSATAARFRRDVQSGPRRLPRHRRKKETRLHYEYENKIPGAAGVADAAERGPRLGRHGRPGRQCLELGGYRQGSRGQQRLFGDAGDGGRCALFSFCAPTGTDHQICP